MSHLGLPARWQRSPPQTDTVDDYLFERHLWGPALRDWALSADGALVYPEYTSPYNHSAPPGSPWHPGIALTDDSRIGRCWSIPASHGQLGIALPGFIFPTNVTIDHIPKAIAADPGQAPRRLVLWGVVDGDGNRARYFAHLDAIRGNRTLPRDAPPLRGDGELFLVLADFLFDVNGSRYIQMFPTSPVARDFGIYVGTVVLEIVDNWGSESTCIYRVRVHGELAEPDQ
ncbi:hypothetical protein LXA43DRAFT_899279 [Ganoderma leucocontextum]|nr:hypothetical protein LXA43DRAFT_899279 [Ganoderma leucocontextum]